MKKSFLEIENKISLIKAMIDDLETDINNLSREGENER